MTDNDFDRSIEERLRAYESRVEGAPVPQLTSEPSRGGASRLAWMSVVAVGGAAAGFALALALNARIGPSVGQPATSPSPTVQASESGAPSPIPTEPAEATSPPTVPAGLLAVSRDGDVHLIRGDGTSVRQLTDDPDSGEAPVAWLLDGSALVYSVTANDNPYSSTLLLIDADGGEPTELGVVHPVYGAPAWSPDGTRIAFGGDGAVSSGIKVLDLSDGSLSTLTEDGGTSPLWSPDGGLIAYTASDGSGHDIHVVDADGGEPVALAPDPAQDQLIRWLPTDDGLKIVFQSWRDTDESKFAARPWVVNVDGTELQLLSDSGLDMDLANHEPVSVPSPDGEWVATALPTGVFVGRDPVAGDERLLPGTQGWDLASVSPTFSAEGLFMAYAHVTDGEEPRYVVAVVVLTPDDPEPLEPEIMTPPGVSDSAPAWQPVAD
jgi:dipeptidyl aminopeptidase/acylaminoacyl peptidase